MAEDDIQPPNLKRPKLQADGETERWKIDANEVLRFHLLDPEKELSVVEDGRPFPAGMCHQHFGPEEEITGYQGLAIDVWLSQRSYQALAEVHYDERQDGADDILKVLQNGFPAGLATSRTEYQSNLKAATPLSIKSLGEAVSMRWLDSHWKLSVYRVDLSKADRTVKDLHAHFQPLLLFFVDGANFIDPEEPGWELLLAVVSKKGVWTVVGLATLYKCYCWPDRTRLRVSQVLVPPPHQGKGVGRALLEAAYAAAEACSAVDVTYEDPTNDLQLIRERIELQRAVRLPWLVDLAGKVAQAAASAHPANGHAQESDEAAVQDPSTIALGQKEQARAQAELRITKQQVRKLWEVLLRAQPQLASDAGACLLRPLVEARLVSSVTSTKRVAEGKRIIDFPDEGFMMAKVSRTAALSAGIPIAMEGEDAEGESAEVREAVLAEAVAQRMEQLEKLVAFIQPHMHWTPLV